MGKLEGMTAPDSDDSDLRFESANRRESAVLGSNHFVTDDGVIQLFECVSKLLHLQLPLPPPQTFKKCTYGCVDLPLRCAQPRSIFRESIRSIFTPLNVDSRFE